MLLLIKIPECRSDNNIQTVLRSYPVFENNAFDNFVYCFNTVNSLVTLEKDRKTVLKFYLTMGQYFFIQDFI